jgi:hypothetical protein
MFGDAMISFREFIMKEPLPIGTILAAVLEFIEDRDDAVLYGAQAVNAYVKETRATEDVDIASTRAPDLADEIRAFLNTRFHIAVRIRNIRKGLGYRLYHVRKPENRHLVGVRPVSVLPPHQRVGSVLVLTPPELIASKVISIADRGKTPKGATDLADLRRLVLTFPKLRASKGPVADALSAAEADYDAVAIWQEIVAKGVETEDEDAEFGRG